MRLPTRKPSYAQVARWEQNEYNKYVTDWERRRYFELI